MHPPRSGGGFELIMSVSQVGWVEWRALTAYHSASKEKCLLRNVLRNDPPGGGTRYLLKDSYSLLRIRGRTRMCVFCIMGCVITIGYAYTVHV